MREEFLFYRHLLDEIVRESREIMGVGLIGVYLHGSMAMGCFHPDKSDIDLLLVVQELSNEQKRMLMECIVCLNRQAPPKGLEISVVKSVYCNPFVYPTPYELHFSPMHLQWFLDEPKEYVEKMHGTDIDLAAHITILREYGIVLWGKPIEQVFAPVPRRYYADSICSDIAHAAEDILEQPIYMTLNLCRVLAYMSDGLILSKKVGGEWGICHLPPQYHPMIREALACYASGRSMDIEKSNAEAFAKEVLRRLQIEGKYGNERNATDFNRRG